jgi:hypothetical protein
MLMLIASRKQQYETTYLIDTISDGSVKLLKLGKHNKTFPPAP